MLRWIDPPRRWLEGLEQPYGRLLERCLRQRGPVLLALALGLVLTAAGLSLRPTAFLPQEDNGQLRGVVVLADGMALPRTQAVLATIRERINSPFQAAALCPGEEMTEQEVSKAVASCRVSPSPACSGRARARSLPWRLARAMHRP